jgi:hypothetical protein
VGPPTVAALRPSPYWRLPYYVSHLAAKGGAAGPPRRGLLPKRIHVNTRKCAPRGSFASVTPLTSRTISGLPLMDVESTEAFEPVRSGTRMRWAWEMKGRGAAGRLMAPVLACILGRRLEETFTNINKVLEGEASTVRTDARVWAGRSGQGYEWAACDRLSSEDRVRYLEVALSAVLSDPSGRAGRVRQRILFPEQIGKQGTCA